MGNVAFDERKALLRAQLKEQRKQLGAQARAAADHLICERVCAHEAFASADVVLTYLSFGPEIDTRELIRASWDAGKTVAIPRVVAGTRLMKWYRIKSFDDLELSSFGVEEPLADPANEQMLGTGERMVAIVPGFTFDKDGYRLGYGGGFYDTFLSEFDGISVGLCRAALAHDDLSSEGVIDVHDRAVDVVIYG